MQLFINYIKGHAGPNFDPVDCFSHGDLHDRAAAEEEFMRDVKNIATWSHSDVRVWAREQVENDFAVSFVHYYLISVKFLSSN